MLQHLLVLELPLLLLLLLLLLGQRCKGWVVAVHLEGGRAEAAHG